MKPLNEQERTKQFFIFLGFFVITNLLIVGIAYFPLNYNLKKQVEILSKRNSEFESQKEIINNSMAEVDSLFEKISRLRGMKSNQIEQGKREVFDKIDEFKKKNSNNENSTSIFSKYSNIYQLCSELIVDVQEQKANVEKLTGNLNDQSKMLTKTESDFEKYRIAHPEK